MAVKKPVSFGENERDQKLLRYSNTKFSFSIYVKELIEKDMEQNQKNNKASRRENKGLNFDF